MVTIGRAATTIANLLLSNMTYGASDVTLAPRSNNPSPFTFSTSSPNVLAVNATTGRVTVVGAGTATITVRQASSANYEAGSESLTVQIARATPTLSSFSAISKDYGDAPFTLTPPVSVSSGAFTYTSSNTDVATVNATTGVVTIVGVGFSTVTATQAQTDNYAGSTAFTTLTVGRGTPVFGNFTITDRAWGASNFTLTAPTSSSSGVFTYTSSNTAVATVNSSSGAVTLVGVGSTNITATQTATALYVSSSITTAFAVTPVAPSFGAFVVSAKTFGDVPFALTPPTSSSGGAFSYTSSDTSIATVNSAGQVTIVGAGSTTITATQAASTQYALRSTTSLLTVAKATVGLSGFGGQTSGLAGVRYSGYYSDNVNWFDSATRTGETVTSTSIQNFTSNADYYSWQWLGTFRAGAGGSYNFCTNSDDASHLWIGANATSGFTTSNTVVNNGGAHAPRTACGNITLSAGAEYPIRIQFGEAGGGDVMSVYFTPPGGSVTYSGAGYYFTSGGLSKTFGDAPFTPTLPSSASTGAITYSSSNPSVATINPTTGLIALQSSGTTTITAEQAATSNYNSASTSTTLTVAAGMSSALSIAVGGSHTCVIAIAGAVKCWGANDYGQLGDGTLTTRSTSANVSGLMSGVSTIVSAYSHTCALTTAGGVKCWGYNVNGQLGDSTQTNQSSPVDVSGLTSGVQAITVGDLHSCALTTGGGVKCWGYNGFGQLGDNSNTSQSTPVDVTGLTSGVVAISGGGAHTCALTSGGGVKCWGFGTLGEIGDGAWTQRNAPVDVSGLTSGVASIAVGALHSCALTTGGGVKCWGYNEFGQVGNNAFGNQGVPVDVWGLTSGVSAISNGGVHTCALTTTGAMKCWGQNDFGQLGDGTTSIRPAPTAVSGLDSGVAAIDVGNGSHSCALLTTGGVKCWGRNTYGQLGDGTTVNRSLPVVVTF